MRTHKASKKQSSDGHSLVSRPVIRQPKSSENTDSQETQEYASQMPEFAIFNPEGDRPTVQPKLVIGLPGDKYEQEADKTAKLVVQKINAPAIARSESRDGQELISQPEKTAQQPIIQRLIYESNNKELLVPTQYYESAIAGVGEDRPLVAQLPQEKKANVSIKSLYETNATKQNLLAFMKQGMFLTDRIDQITTLADAASLKNKQLHPNNEGLVNTELWNAFRSYRKLVVADGKFYTADAVKNATQNVLLPSDYIPEADDLVGSEGKNLKTTKDKQNRLWWGYACRLIALAKMDASFAKTKQLTGKQNINTLEQAVQELHNYYYNQNKKVMYDDTSSSTTVYPEWGYKLMYSGPCSLDLLLEKAKLNTGSYIFDIEGHSVKTKVLKDRDPGTVSIPANELDNYFEFDSDPTNYTRGTEKTKSVQYVWGK